MLKRLDPDEILKEIVKLSSGRHKIYLGMAPGVGKTFKMLEESLELKKKGIDIVIAYVELQKRPENDFLINSFQTIPRKTYKVNNKEFSELDLEGIIERKPATVIIDELAHTNVPGSLNQKRYQDVLEILKTGISVLSTINVHQIESIAQIVEKNIGVKINETVPDFIVHQADELVLVDITIEELYHRLETKQIYSQEQLKHALKNFFKKNNLILLRDLALNLVTEKVDIEVVSQKVKARIKDRILVAASPKENSIKLIRHAGEIASTMHADIDILTMLKEKDSKKEKILEKLRETTKPYKCNFFLIKDLKRNKADEIIHFIKSNRITLAIIGYSKKPKWKEQLMGSVVFKVLEKTSNIDLLIVGKQEEDIKIIKPEVQKLKETSLNFGKLKIYIGMAPGVGKTYKMLQEAHELKHQGVNVLLGVIETHGRVETAKLMEGLNALPLKLIEHKGKFLGEFDLEGAILAKPDYILIDELAHTNVLGAINNKRYQDVQYLLRAGINVISTVNIQHIESLNDIVEQVTGIKVRETLPDWIMSHASEIVLIDISPEALQERLQAGKVYSLDKIEQALTHFFQKKNLIALRELSLREVAESVEHELHPKEKKLKILCLVDINDETIRLIRKSARIANRLQAELIVMHMIKNIKQLSEEKKIAIIDLEQLVVELGGDFRLVEGKSIINEIINAEKKIAPNYIILGEPSKKGLFNFWRDTTVRKVLNKISGPHIWIVGDFTREVVE